MAYFLALATSAIAWFLWSQMQKKFRMLYLGLIRRNFTTFYVETSRMFNREPHMRNFVARSADGKPFVLTVYLLIGDDMADPFLAVESDDSGVAVIDTYVGYMTPVLFFESTSAAHLTVTSTAEDQKLISRASAEPHWFQKTILFAKVSQWIADKF